MSSDDGTPTDSQPRPDAPAPEEAAATPDAAPAPDTVPAPEAEAGGSKTEARLRWAVVAAAIISVIGLLLVFLMPSGSESAVAIHYNQVGGPDGQVQNGRAYDKVTINLDGIETLVIPGISGVEVDPELEGRALILITKQLGYNGPSDGPLTPLDARASMGLAVQRDGGTLRIGTYGEFDTMNPATRTGDGGARIVLQVFVPRGTRTRPDGTLGGPRAVSNGPKTGETVWPGPIAPAEGWERLVDVPAPDFADTEDRGGSVFRGPFGR